jgi:hypothetical protein
VKYDTIARIGGIAWLVGFVALAAPVALLWAIKLFAAIAGCAPGPQPCSALPLGPWFKTALGFVLGLTTWVLGAPVAFVLALAGIAAGSVWRTVAGVGAPLAALILAVIAALSTTFAGCNVSEGGASGCTLWGADVNESFGIVGVAPWMVLFVPFFAIAAAPLAIVAAVVRRRYAAATVKPA